MKKSHIIYLLTSILLSSCSLYNSNLQYYERAKEYNTVKSVYLRMKVFQTLDRNFGLAFLDENGHYVGDVVALQYPQTFIYDGFTISGDFVVIDTYTYTTRDTITKTVPIVITKKDYLKLISDENTSTLSENKIQ